MDIRLARHLLQLAGETLTLQSTHQQLAVELGSAREVISRQLKDFELRNWVRLQRGCIKIVDPRALKFFSDV